jgi:23S rRNA (guanosine2251-2'-O)-methyltransferase
MEDKPKKREKRRSDKEYNGYKGASYEKNENLIEGRNACLEAYRAGKTIDKIFILDGAKEGQIQTIIKEARKSGSIINFVKKERLDSMSSTGKHQGVIAVAAAYAYAELEDIFDLAAKKGESPFIIIADKIEDPHNLGSIIRTANLAGAHGIIVPKHHAVGLTAVVSKASAGAINYTPVVKVVNIARTIEELKEKGLWFVCADMGGESMYELNMTGPIGLVMGAEGTGVSRLVKEKCDMTAQIPMKGDIDSLNVSVACGVLAFEIARQRAGYGIK